MATRPFCHHRQQLGRIPIFRLAAVILLLVLGSIVLAPAERAAAHAYLERSTPAANAIVSSPPERVQLLFTEPLERTYTGAELYNYRGEVVSGTSFEFDDQNRYAASLVLPADLPNGTYSVVWRTLSSADGHPAQGYFSFTIGTAADVRTFIPPAVSETEGPPEWLRAVSRWLPMLGLALAIAVWPVWLWVLRPAISPAWQAGVPLARRTKRLAAIGIIGALLGSVVALVVQAMSASDESLLEATQTTLTETRYGRLWLVRIGLLLALALVLGVAAWWWPRRRRWATALVLVVIAALPVPFSLLSHAAAQTSGRTTAIAFDVLHLLSASLWIGGLFVLVGALLPTLRDLTSEGRRVVLSRAIPRFSVLALTSWGVLLVTGLYAGWLQVGNLTALRETAYGTSLTIKLLLLIPLLILAAFNLLVVSRRIRRGENGQAGSLWSRRFAFAVGAEAVLVVVLLLVVGRLISQPPAREELAQNAGVARIELDLQGRPARLAVAPAATGPNHYRLEVDGDTLPPQTEALLRLTLPTNREIQKEVLLERVPGNAFEGHGAELSIQGSWDIQAIVRLIGEFNYSGRATLEIADTPPSTNLPGTPWRFSSGGIIGILLAVGGIGALALAWYAGRTPLRRESAGLGTVAIALGAILLLQARVGEAGQTVDILASNPIPASEDSIALGKTLYEANCVACHGAAGRGDGPAAEGLDPPYPPPADFTTGHARSHYDGEFFNWIKSGKPPTAMPAFGDRLSDEEIWHVINYVRWLQENPDLAAAEAQETPASSLSASATPTP